MKNNPYKTLLIDPQATNEVIKAAYRALMKSDEIHPDLGGSIERAQLLNEAYAILISATKRKELDIQLQQEREREEANIASKRTQGRKTTASQKNTVKNLVVCLRCGSLNELEYADLVKIAKCGKCLHSFMEQVGRQEKRKEAENVSAKNLQKSKQRSAKSNVPDKDFAKFMYDKQLYLRALDDYLKLMRSQPQEMDFIYMAGMCYYKMAHYEDARKYFTNCLQVNPDSFKGNLYLGKSLLKENKFGFAIPYFKKASALNKSSLKPKSLLGLCLYKSAYYKQAIEVLNQVIMKNPSLDQAIYYMAMCYYKMRQFEKAHSCFLLSIQIFPKDKRLFEMAEHCRKNLLSVNR